MGREKPVADVRAVPTYDMFGLPVSDVDGDGLLALIDGALGRGQRFVYLYANAYILNEVARNPALIDLFDGADVIVNDGFGSALAIRMVHGVTPARVTMPDLIDRAAALCIRRDAGMFLLGSTEAGVAGSERELLARHPALPVVGRQHGYFDKTPGGAENDAVVAAINASGADVLLIGFGMPLQERWLRDNVHRLDCTVIIAVGALFDVLSGELKRGPKLLTDNGFEWLTRLLNEPGRLWRRYLIGLPTFFARAVMLKLGRRG